MGSEIDFLGRFVFYGKIIDMKRVISAVLCLLAGFALARAAQTVQVDVSGLSVQAEIADSDMLRQQGLMFRDNIKEGEGMLFVFPIEGRHAFWMKNMRFPLDIIWIKGNKIVKIDQNVPIPTKGETSPKLYYPPISVNYVLEVNAGFSKKNNLGIGDLVKI